MALTLPSQQAEFELPPLGSHIATCYRVIDLGTQLVDYKGTQKKQHKIMLGWELPDEKMSDGRLFTISQRYTLSSHDKSTLRKHLESWRGQPFSDDDFGKFDIGVLVGKGCMLGIVHAASNGNTYANISAIMKLPKGQAATDLVNDKMYFDLSNFDQATFDRLSDGIKAIIAKSPEYQALKGGHTVEQQTGNYDQEMPNDDIPF